MDPKDSNDDAAPAPKTDDGEASPGRRAADAAAATSDATATPETERSPETDTTPADERDRLRALNEQLRLEHERAGKVREHELRRRH